MLKPASCPPTAFNSPLTAAHKSAEPRVYLLIKNLPDALTDAQLKALLPVQHEVAEVIRVAESHNVYLSFRSLAQVEQIATAAEAAPVFFAGRRLRMCVVNKLPLDLNCSSAVVLATIYQEKIAVNVFTLTAAFADFGPFVKIIVYRKKNFQALLQFPTPAAAQRFKQALNNRSFNGLFSVKVQFTQKQDLVVNFNSEFEHDFTLKEPGLSFFPAKGKVDYSNTECKPGREAPPRTFMSEKKPACARKLLFDDDSDGNLEEVFLCNDEDDFETRVEEEVVPEPPQKRISVTAANLVLVSNVGPGVKHKHLFNLFSLYGSISRLSADDKGAAVIEFCSELEAATAVYYLNGVSLFGRPIITDVVKEVPADFSAESTLEYASKKVCAEGGSRQKTVNKPSPTLYVFNISKKTTLAEIRKQFEAVAKPEEVHYSNESRNSALCRFCSVEAAVRVLCCFKNSSMGEKSLKINFANEALVRAKKFGDLAARRDRLPCKRFEEFLPADA